MPTSRGPVPRQRHRGGDDGAASPTSRGGGGARRSGSRATDLYRSGREHVHRRTCGFVSIPRPSTRPSASDHRARAKPSVRAARRASAATMAASGRSSWKFAARTPRRARWRRGRPRGARSRASPERAAQAEDGGEAQGEEAQHHRLGGEGGDREDEVEERRPRRSPAADRRTSPRGSRAARRGPCARLRWQSQRRARGGWRGPTRAAADR